jgi:hypothetical protein
MNQNGNNTLHATQSSTGPETSTYYAHHDFDGTAKLSTTVIHALSEGVNTDTRDMETTLFQHVDPDALDALVQSNGAPTDSDSVTVSFRFAEQQVTVHGTGEIVVRPVELDR